MGLFDSLANSPQTPEDLASSLELYLPAVRAWCSAAAAYEMLSIGSRRKLSLRPGMRAFLLDKSHPDYLGGQFSYLALRSTEYSGFERLFRYGKTRPMSNSFQAIEEATHWDHYALLRVIKSDKSLSRIMTTGCKFADVGCGTGSLLQKLSREYTNSKFYGIDSSTTAIAIARKALKGAPVVLKRMRAEGLAIREEFDVIYLGESLYAAADKGKVIRNCFKSLKPGGRILVMEGLLPKHPVKKADLLIMGMQLDFALQGHEFITTVEMQNLLKDAGFTQLRFCALGGSTFLVTARK